MTTYTVDWYTSSPIHQKTFKSLLKARAFACSKCRMSKFLNTNIYYPTDYVMIFADMDMVEYVRHFNNVFTGDRVLNGYYANINNNVNTSERFVKISPTTGKILERIR